MGTEPLRKDTVDVGVGGEVPAGKTSEEVELSLDWDNDMASGNYRAALEKFVSAIDAAKGGSDVAATLRYA